jgi:hypothetical protein
MHRTGGIAGPAAGFFGSSATMASVVIRSAATEAAFWIAVRGRKMRALVFSIRSVVPQSDQVARPDRPDRGQTKFR